MPRLSRLLALLAAIMLVIGGAPAVAAAQPCDPCPPDCPMMQQMTAAMADSHDQAPAKSGKAENPCKQGLVCQAATAAVAAPSATLVAFALSANAVDHSLADALDAPSRPPDRNLRPPIKL